MFGSLLLYCAELGHWQWVFSVALRLPYLHSSHSMRYWGSPSSDMEVAENSTCPFGESNPSYSPLIHNDRLTELFLPFCNTFTMKLTPLNWPYPAGNANHNSAVI